MANVGNLFVNISGSTKGLTKALTSAKTKLATFDKQVGRPGGDFMRRARSRFTSAMRERYDQTLRERMGAGGTEGHREMMRARIGKKEKSARQAYRQAQREQVISGMQTRQKMMMSAALGAIGLTVGAATIIGRKALSQVNAAKQGVDKFRMLGPSANRIIAAEVGMRLNSMKTAMRPEVSEALAERAEARLAAQAQSNFSGATGLSIESDTYFEKFGQMLLGVFTGLFTDPAGTLGGVMSPYNLNNPLNQGKTTGPVSTTGNTGGP